MSRPTGLQINRALRVAAMQAYYSHTTFRFSDKDICVDWPHSMTAEQRGLLRRVHYLWGPCGNWSLLSARFALSHALFFYYRQGVPLDREILFIHGTAVEPIIWYTHKQLDQSLGAVKQLLQSCLT